jgi:hypothetical protein
MNLVADLLWLFRSFYLLYAALPSKVSGCLSHIKEVLVYVIGYQYRNVIVLYRVAIFAHFYYIYKEVLVYVIGYQYCNVIALETLYDVAILIANDVYEYFLNIYIYIQCF